jgi:hypothetical protein
VRPRPRSSVRSNALTARALAVTTHVTEAEVQPANSVRRIARAVYGGWRQPTATQLECSQALAAASFVGDRLSPHGLGMLWRCLLSTRDLSGRLSLPCPPRDAATRPHCRWLYRLRIPLHPINRSDAIRSLFRGSDQDSERSDEGGAGQAAVWGSGWGFRPFWRRIEEPRSVRT